MSEIDNKTISMTFDFLIYIQVQLDGAVDVCVCGQIGYHLSGAV